MLAMICRADSGGLGVQLWEIARHVRPDRILIIRVGDGRGDFRPDRYSDLCTDIMVVANPPEPDHMRWLCDGTDRVFTVEGCYQDRLVSIARQAGAELSILANPELFPKAYREMAERKLIRVFAPTEWERDRLGPNELLPMPVALDRCHPAERAPDNARRFLHVSAPAFHDRNGTNIVRAAVDVYHGPRIELFVTGPDRPTEAVTRGGVHILPVNHVPDYWDLYEDIDVLVLPRRYGGLSLVAQEALACGVPAVMLDREPERSWGGVHVTEVTGSRAEHMKGGEFDVCEGNPMSVARAMHDMAIGAHVEYRQAALDHAETISWARLLPQWLTALDHWQVRAAW